MAGRPKGSTNAKEEKAIEAYSPVQENASEVKFESQVLTHLEEKPDLSRMDESAKMESLANLLQCIPTQYLSPENIKETIYALARFYPTDEQLANAAAYAANPPQRFPN